MRLDYNDKDKLKEFIEFTKKSEYGNIFQTLAWASVKANWDKHIFYLEEENKIVAGLIVLSIKDSIVNKRFYYSPRGPICDIWDIDKVLNLIEEAKNFAKSNGGFLLRIDPQVPYDSDLEKLYYSNGIEFKRSTNFTSQPPMNTILDIGGRNIEEVYKNLSKSTKRAIRKAKEWGVEIVEGNYDDLDTFYTLIEGMAKRQGISYRPYSYFDKLYKEFKDNIRMSFAEYEGEYIAASMLIYFNGVGFSIYGGDPIKYRLNQSYLLNYEEIKFCTENNLDYYDMGGVYSTDAEDGLYNFKKKFTESNVVHWIGNIDLILEKDTYEKYKKITIENSVH